MNTRDKHKDIYLFWMVIISFTLIAYSILKGKMNYTNVPLFWTLWLMSITLLTKIALSYDGKYFLVSMTLFQVVITSIIVFGSPSVLPIGTDAIFESQYAKTLITNRYWDIHAGYGLAKDYYGYFPVIHVVMAFLSLLTNVDIYTIGIYFPFIEHVMYFLFYFMVIKKIFNTKFAIISSLIAFSSCSLILIHTSRRLFTEPFILLLLIAIYINYFKQRGSIGYSIVFLLSVPLISLGHHWCGYLSIWIISVILLFTFFIRIKSKKFIEKINLTTPFALVFVTVCSWIAYFAFEGLFKRDVNILSYALNRVLSLSIHGTETTIRNVGTTYGYMIFYRYIIILSMFLFYSLSLIATIKFLQFTIKNPSPRNIFTAGWVTACCIIVFSTAFTVFVPDYRFIGQVSMGVGSLGLSIAIAHLLLRREIGRNNFTIILITLLMILYSGGILVAYLPQYYVNPYGKFWEGTADVVSSAKWLSGYVDKDEEVSGDSSSYNVFTGVYGIPVRHDNSLLYANNIDFQESLVEYSTNLRIRWFIINNIITEYNTFGPNRKVSPEELDRFGDTNLLDKLYSNPSVDIYLISPLKPGTAR